MLLKTLWRKGEWRHPAFSPFLSIFLFAFTNKSDTLSHHLVMVCKFSQHYSFTSSRINGTDPNNLVSRALNLKIQGCKFDPLAGQPNNYQLSFGWDFNTFPNKPWFLCVCSTSLLKTLREKEKFACNKQFLLFPQCFLHFWRTCRHFHQVLNCCLQRL